ncbi:MAG: Ribosomal protein S7 [uncultured bacterium]|nr:MAG: Ribosomal protein S7 [uncultured bacterium]OGH14736.1 MAG: 30S ribosomal protein S7 [Candidatus Levybacteria bacterium RIFCSPHIGHO2_01_FULL_38_26]
MRHKKTKKRIIEPDAIYKNRLVTQFVNYLMKSGKKTVAENLVYKSFDILSKDSKDPIAVFEQALQNVGPKQEVKARRVGGASYQIPVEIRGERRMSLAMRWIIQAARSRSNKEFHSFSDKLAIELMEASDNRGEAIKKRDIAHRMAQANKAFAHFRW